MSLNGDRTRRQSRRSIPASRGSCGAGRGGSGVETTQSARRSQSAVQASGSKAAWTVIPPRSAGAEPARGRNTSPTLALRFAAVWAATIAMPLARQRQTPAAARAARHPCSAPGRATRAGWLRHSSDPASLEPTAAPPPGRSARWPQDDFPASAESERSPDNAGAPSESAAHKKSAKLPPPLRAGSANANPAADPSLPRKPLRGGRANRR